MRVLHMATLKSAVLNPGVTVQMEWEKAAATKLGLNWDVELWTGDDLGSSPIQRRVRPPRSSRIVRQIEFSRRLRSAAHAYDTILIRYVPLDLIGALLPFSSAAKIWYIFHTNMGAYLSAEFGLLGHALGRADDMIGARSLRHAEGVIGVTEELLVKEAKRLGYNGSNRVTYPNGLYLEDWAQLPEDSRGCDLQIAFVAARFFPWNGLESLLGSIVSSRIRRGWKLHLVGALSPEQMQIIQNDELSSVVCVHGCMSKKELTRMLPAMHLTLGAFNLPNVQMTEACTLKVRESLGSGIAVYSGHVDAALPLSFPYYRMGPPDIESILEFASEMRRASRFEVKSAARPFIDKEKILKRMYSEIVRA